MLEIQKLVVRRGSFCAELPHLSVKAGQCVALCGVSGCGKSTLLEAIGLLSPWESVSSFCFNQINVDKLSAELLQALRVSQMGIMPQVGGLIPYLTVAENLKIQIALALKQQLCVELPDASSATSAAATSLDASSSSTAAPVLHVRNLYTRAREHEYMSSLETLSAKLHLSEHLHKLPHELSIGQRQRALFLRAIAHRPRLLLIDEPTSSLDPDNARSLFALIDEIAHESQLSVLLVTHDLKAASRYQCYLYDASRSHMDYSLFAPAATADTAALGDDDADAACADAMAPSGDTTAGAQV